MHLSPVPQFGSQTGHARPRAEACRGRGAGAYHAALALLLELRQVPFPGPRGAIGEDQVGAIKLGHLLRHETQARADEIAALLDMLDLNGMCHRAKPLGMIVSESSFMELNARAEEGATLLGPPLSEKSIVT